METCTILSIKNWLWVLKGSRVGINNDVVDDREITFGIDGEETERTLTKAQGEACKEVCRVLDSA